MIHNSPVAVYDLSVISSFTSKGAGVSSTIVRHTGPLSSYTVYDDWLKVTQTKQK